MNRISLRIFLAFWLVVAVVLGGFWALNQHLASQQAEHRQREQRIEGLRGELSPAARAALREGGKTALLDWLERSDRQHRQLSMLLLDETGKELRGRPLPEDVQALAEAWRQGDRRAALRRFARGRLLIPLESASQRYLLVLQREPEPLLLRVFGPLGPQGLLALALLVSGLACYLLARNLSRPLRELGEVGRRLAAGELAARASPSSLERGDEIGELCRDFNRMADRLQAQVEHQRQLLRDVSHELRSPLARIQMALVLAEDARDESQRLARLQRIREETERLDKLLARVLEHARMIQAPRAQMQPLDLRQLLEGLIEDVALLAAGRALRIELEGPARLEIHGEAETLLSVFDNLLRNALRHAPDGSRVQLAMADAGDTVSVTVRDHGPGVPQADLERIFEPFVRLSPERSEAGEGGGVGLAIAREGVRRHGGQIRARNADGGGLAVEVRLPRQPRCEQGRLGS